MRWINIILFNAFLHINKNVRNVPFWKIVDQEYDVFIYLYVFRQNSMSCRGRHWIEVSVCVSKSRLSFEVSETKGAWGLRADRQMATFPKGPTEQEECAMDLGGPP